MEDSSAPAPTTLVGQLDNIPTIVQKSIDIESLSSQDVKGVQKIPSGRGRGSSKDKESDSSKLQLQIKIPAEKTRDKIADQEIEFVLDILNEDFEVKH